MSKQLTATERYRQTIQNGAPKLEDITAPSGMVFKFYASNDVSTLFEDAGGDTDLPMTIADEAAESWQADGVYTPAIPVETDLKPQSETDYQRNIRIAEARRDKVLALSYDPKIVMGKATKPNELSASHILPDDLGYLYRWISAGGNAALMAAMFPEKPQSSRRAGIDGAELRAKIKRASRHKK